MIQCNPARYRPDLLSPTVCADPGAKADIVFLFFQGKFHTHHDKIRITDQSESTQVK